MKSPGKAEPRFDIDLAYGKQGELQVKEFLGWIARGNGQVEVKRKRWIDMYFYVETHCDKGRRGDYQPSGISVTTSKMWTFVIGDIGLYVSFETDLIRELLNDLGTRDKEENDGDCPTKGRFVNLAAALYRYEQRRKQALQAATAAKPAPAPAAPPAPKSKPSEITDLDMNWNF